MRTQKDRSTEAEDPVTSREQDAVRILLLLDGAGEPVDDTERALPGLDRAGVRTTVRLQKLVFWLRNPDYLADELLSDYETSREEQLLAMAASILDSEELTMLADPGRRRNSSCTHPGCGAYFP